MKASAMFLVLLGGALSVPSCAPDTSTSVHLAPSAAQHAQAAYMAADWLNARLGELRFVVVEERSGDRLDGAVVIRGVYDLGGDNPDDPSHYMGRTYRTHDGVVIKLTPDATANVIAHEMAHAAGLQHVGDPRNLMYPYNGDNWELTDEQVEFLK